MLLAAGPHGKYKDHQCTKLGIHGLKGLMLLNGFCKNIPADHLKERLFG
ncbi:MAG: hypothetical protein ACI965_000017 [Paraglaciecola sp.]|jgi:hypothetical protein